MTSDLSTSSSTTPSSDTLHSPTSVVSAPRTPARNISLSPDFSPSDRRLLHYWISQLSSLISVAPRNGSPTPFQLHLTSMAYDSPALRSTILSMAANHLALQTCDPSLRIQAYRHQQAAIQHLQTLIQDPQHAHSEPALATVLMMQVSARLFSEDADSSSGTVVNHLMGAKAMIAKRGGVQNWLRGSSSARFLLSLFAYHDILSSISRGHGPLSNHSDAGFDAVEGAPDMRDIAAILLVVARTSHLQHAIRTRRARGGAYALTEEEDAAGRALQQDLLLMQFPLPPPPTSPSSSSSSSSSSSTHTDSDTSLTTTAYLHSAFIYLYRVWLGVGAPNPISASHITSCLASLASVPLSSPLTSAHIWPLFSAGCEAIDPAQRAFVRERFSGMYEQRRFPSWERVARDVEVVWAAKDEEGRRAREGGGTGGAGGMERVDCIEVVWGRRGREVDLA